MYRVLVVEDDSEVCALLKRLLNVTGVTTDCVLNSYDALEILKVACSFHYHALITDVNLPWMDGMSLAHIFKANQRISIIVVSASENLVVNPTFWFFQKPFTVKDLEDIKRTIEQLRDTEEMFPTKYPCLEDRCVFPGVTGTGVYCMHLSTIP